MNSPDSIHYFTNIRWQPETPKYQSLISFIKEGILDNTLQDWLPSSRQLATLCGLNRNTIVKALEELVWEGWLLSFPQKGLKVNSSMAQTRQAASGPRKLSYHLKKTAFHNFPQSGISVQETTYQLSLTKFLQQWAHTDPRELLQEWIFKKWHIELPVSHIGFANSLFECNYIISRLLLEDGDSIIGSKQAKNALSPHLPNLDIRLISLPVHNGRLQLDTLKQILATNNNIKFLYLHNILDDLQPDPLTLMSLMELCFRHGVLIIENLVIRPDNLLHKINLWKYYDYKHYVITCIHNQLIAGKQFSYIIAHTSIQDQIANARENIQSYIHLPSLAFHLQYLLHPKLLSRITHPS